MNSISLYPIKFGRPRRWSKSMLLDSAPVIGRSIGVGQKAIAINVATYPAPSSIVLVRWGALTRRLSDTLNRGD